VSEKQKRETAKMERTGPKTKEHSPAKEFFTVKKSVCPPRSSLILAQGEKPPYGR
jgi:hypothetical protein